MIAVIHDGAIVSHLMKEATVLDKCLYQLGRPIGVPNAELDLVPDQDVEHIYERTETEERIVGVWPESFVLCSLEENKALLDSGTAAHIDRAMHPLVGVQEQIGILRDQVVQWGNKLGLEFTEDFARLNNIAIAEIEKGAVEKAAITDA